MCLETQLLATIVRCRSVDVSWFVTVLLILMNAKPNISVHKKTPGWLMTNNRSYLKQWPARRRPAQSTLEGYTTLIFKLRVPWTSALLGIISLVPLSLGCIPNFKWISLLYMTGNQKSNATDACGSIAPPLPLSSKSLHTGRLGYVCIRYITHYYFRCFI